MIHNKVKTLLSNAIEKAMTFTPSTRWISTLYITHLQRLDLMEPSTFGTKTANRGSRLWQGAVSLYLPALSIMMAPFSHIQSVMIGARVQKITTQQQQKHPFTCIYHRNLKSKANQGLEPVVESSDVLVIVVLLILVQAKISSSNLIDKISC